MKWAGNVIHLIFSDTESDLFLSYHLKLPYIERFNHGSAFTRSSSPGQRGLDSINRNGIGPDGLHKVDDSRHPTDFSQKWRVLLRCDWHLDGLSRPRMRQMRHGCRLPKFLARFMLN